MKTIYQLAQEAMKMEIEDYLNLTKISKGFVELKTEHLLDSHTARLFASGIGMEWTDQNPLPMSQLLEEQRRKSAVPFDVEKAVTVGVYHQVRPYVASLFEHAEQLTEGFTTFNANTLHQHPALLPVFQNLLTVSKAQLKKQVGVVSDTGFSKPGSERLAELLNHAIRPHQVSKTKVLQRLEITMEGIVRDLVGRILFEEIVAQALSSQGVDYLRESEYTSLAGVIYDVRADFVIPDSKRPVAFIEVRKSSSRHASLYAKDKMFSAINWKGRHKQLIGVMVVEGDWTQATLQSLAKVFDYVVPLHNCVEVAKILKNAQNGDESVLRWLIELSIQPSEKFARRIEV